MQTFTEDSEYVQLKSIIKQKEFAAKVFGFVASALVLAGFAIGTGIAAPIIPAALFASGSITTLGMVAAVATAAIALFSGYKSFRLMQDVNLDTQELDARRSAIHLGRALDLQKASDAHVAAALKPRTNWREEVQASRMGAALSEGRQA